MIRSEIVVVKMQNPNEDTEWNDILRKKGIIPEKTPEPEISEETLIAMMDKTIKVTIYTVCTVDSSCSGTG